MTATASAAGRAVGSERTRYDAGRTATSDLEKSTSLTMLKGLTILEYVASQSGTLAVGEVAAAIGMDKSTVSRLLASLRVAGYVRQGRDRRYQLTSKLLFLTRNFVPAEHLREAARPVTEKVHATFDEAVHVAGVDGGEIVFVDFLDSSHAVRSQTPTTPSPLHLTAIGRAVLAGMTDDARDAAIRDSADAAGVALSETTTTELQKSIELAKSAGFATFDADDDVVRIAVAILDDSGDPVGGLSVSGPSYRLGDRVEEIGRLLVTAVAGVRG